MSKAVVQVSALVAKISTFLAKHVNLSNLQIAGQISNLRNVRGHLYFDLKDEKGQMPCVMWYTNAARLAFRPDNGMSVLVDATLSVYEARGTLQLMVSHMEAAGEGMLAAILEERKRRLDAQGYFSSAHKKPKPDVIGRIAIVTGNDTAALKDVEKTIASRWPMMERVLFPASVQGEKAPKEIIRQLRKADGMGFDAILLVRGGGSMEDLFCFNDEELVKTIYDLNTYIVTGVGHEIDYTLVDYVADHRAVTPTAAAQWVSLDQHQLMDTIKSQQAMMCDIARRIFAQNAQALINIQSSVWLSHPETWIESRKNAWKNLDQALKAALPGMMDAAGARLRQFDSQMQTSMIAIKSARHSQLAALNNTLMLYSPASRLQGMEKELMYTRREMEIQLHNRLDKAANDLGFIQKALVQQSPARAIAQASASLTSLEQLLYANSPMAILEKGYAMVWQDGHQMHHASQAEPGKALTIQLFDGNVLAKVEGIQLNPDQNQKSSENPD